MADKTDEPRRKSGLRLNLPPLESGWMHVGELKWISVHDIEPSKPLFDNDATVLTINDRMCRWPIGDPSANEFHFCGHPPKSGSPYCEAHARKAYQPQNPHRSSPLEASSVAGNAAAHEASNMQSRVTSNDFGDPPASAAKVLYLLMPADDRDPVIGDLDETYLKVVSRFGEQYARRWYWTQAIKTVAFYPLRAVADYFREAVAGAIAKWLGS